MKQISVSAMCEFTIGDTDKNQWDLLERFLEEHDMTLDDFIQDDDSVLEFIQDNIDCVDVDINLLTTQTASFEMISKEDRNDM